MIGDVVMNSNIETLREFLNDDTINKTELKLNTFCELMRNVSKKIEEEQRNIIKINLDEIEINKITGEVILPEKLFSKENDLDKTMAGFNTGVSLIADRKSTKEHKRISFALMVLGWYCNPNKDAISNDLDVLENFSYYMSKVPEWLRPFFINIFRKMEYETSFEEYYDQNFTEKIKNEVKKSFSGYNLNDEQINRICNVVINKGIREGAQNE